MINTKQKILNLINVVTDIVLVFASYWLSMYIRFKVLKGTQAYDMLSGTFLLFAFLYGCIVCIGYYITGIYDRFRFSRIKSESYKIFIVNAIGILIFIAGLFIFRVTEFSRWAIVIFYAIASIVLIIKRAILRSLYNKRLSKSSNMQHVAIVGDGNLAVQFADDVRRDPSFQIIIDGYFGKDGAGFAHCLGSYEQMHEVLNGTKLDTLIVALDSYETQYLNVALDIADKEGLRVELVPFYNSYMPANTTIESVGKSKLINLRATPLDNLFWAGIKRLIDIVGSAILIVLTSPIMIVAAIGVKLSSPGPIFFLQERVGKNKEVFNMLKFRSMRTDIDHTGWSTNDDPRKTKFGSFIRKNSIDELPQFFNVFVGQMSLVGPRPEIPRYVNEFKESVPRYLVRQQVRPGITGWAQVNGLRGDTSIDARVDYDIWYIENWSLGLDIRILWDTVFGGKFKNDEVVKK